MKILEPVDSVPGGALRIGRYAQVYEAAEALRDGAVLPVECEGVHEAQKLAQSVDHRNRGRADFPFRASKRGNIVYISRIK